MKQNNFTRFVNQNRSKILTAIGVGGLWGAAIWSNFCTVKVTRLVDEEKKKRGVDKLSAKDVIKLGWKHYIAPLSTGMASTASVIASDVDQNKHISALQAGLALAETGKEMFIEETKKQIGDAATKAIEDSVQEKLIEEKQPCADESDIINTGYGEILYFEPNSGHYFRSSPSAIAMGFTKMKDELQKGSIALNDWLGYLNLEYIRIGWELGLDDSNLRDLQLDIETRSVPCRATGGAAIIVEIGCDFHADYIHYHG